MRFKWHKVTLIPIVSQLPAARLALVSAGSPFELSISSRGSVSFQKGSPVLRSRSVTAQSISRSSSVSDDKVLLQRGPQEDSVHLSLRCLRRWRVKSSWARGRA